MYCVSLMVSVKSRTKIIIVHLDNWQWALVQQFKYFLSLLYPFIAYSFLWQMLKDLKETWEYCCVYPSCLSIVCVSVQWYQSGRIEFFYICICLSNIFLHLYLDWEGHRQVWKRSNPPSLEFLWSVYVSLFLFRKHYLWISGFSFQLRITFCKDFAQYHLTPGS